MADKNKPAGQPTRRSPGSEENPAHAILAATRESFKGPLPPPQLLEHYEKITPGLADRIVKMAEEESVHRRAIEHKLIEIGKRDQADRASETRLGQIFGFGIGVITIVCGSYVAVAGQPWAGGFIGGTGVVGLVTAFIVGRKDASEEEEKEK